MFSKMSMILFTGGVSAPVHAGIHTHPGQVQSYWNAFLFTNNDHSAVLLSTLTLFIMLCCS